MFNINDKAIDTTYGDIFDISTFKELYEDDVMLPDDGSLYVVYKAPDNNFYKTDVYIKEFHRPEISKYSLYDIESLSENIYIAFYGR